MRRRDFIVGSLALGAGGCAARSLGGTVPAPAANTIRVMTLNVAHGRGRRLTQHEGQPAANFRHNLDEIAEVIRRERPHVVALQEAELGSTWAGNFDHVAYLAAAAGMPYLHAVPHVQKPGTWSYGTALLSRLALFERGGATHERPAPWKKGYTLVSAAWPRHGLVDFVSLHLDYARERTRHEQADHLIAALRERPHPLVVMGDFNTGWSRNSPVRRIAKALDLHPHARPPNRTPPTFPLFGRRFDWILVSRGIEFREARVLRDRLSDHRAVVADLRLSSK